jgi:hypothetical protein
MWIKIFNDFYAVREVKGESTDNEAVNSPNLVASKKCDKEK